jgi:hypothetical protein
MPVNRGVRGYEAACIYYQGVFIQSLPDGWQVQAINRVIGADQLVEEGRITFTHTTH